MKIDNGPFQKNPGSMYGILIYLHLVDFDGFHVCKYTIHGSYGNEQAIL